MRRLLPIFLLAACGSDTPCTIEGARMICPGGQSELPATCRFEAGDSGRRLVCPDGTSAVVEEARCRIEGDLLLCPGLRLQLRRDLPVQVSGWAERFLRPGPGVRVAVDGGAPIALAGSGFTLELDVGLHELTFQAEGYEAVTRRVLALPDLTEVEPVTLLPGSTLPVVPLGTPRVLAGGDGFTVRIWRDEAEAQAVFHGRSPEPVAVVPGAYLGGDDRSGVLLTGPATWWVDLRSDELVPVEDCTYAGLLGGLVVCLSAGGWRVWDPESRTGRVVASSRAPDVSPGGTWLVTTENDLATFEHRPSGLRTVMATWSWGFVTDWLLVAGGVLWDAHRETLESLDEIYAGAWPIEGGVVLARGSELVVRDETLAVQGSPLPCRFPPCAGPVARPGDPAFAVASSSGVDFYDARAASAGKWRLAGVVSMEAVAPFTVFARTGRGESWFYRADTGVALSGMTWSRAAAVSPGGRYLAVLGSEYQVVIGDTVAGRWATLADDRSAAAQLGFAGEERVWVVSRDDLVLRRYDLGGGAPLPVAPAPDDTVALADGSLIVAWNGTLRRVDP